MVKYRNCDLSVNRAIGFVLISASLFHLELWLIVMTDLILPFQIFQSNMKATIDYIRPDLCRFKRVSYDCGGKYILYVTFFTLR